MSTSIPIVLPGNKAVVSSNQVQISSQISGAPPAAAGDRQRRGGTSFPSHSSQRTNASTPRNNQSLRKQNKASRRPKLAEDMSDATAIRTSGRKGQTNITHLMNFTLPPRPQNYPHYGHASRGSYSGRRHNYSWGYNAVDKARYIHANYRFIVDPRGNYDHLASVDDHVDWKDVLQVLVSSRSQSTNCPICLSDPVAPRMAKCGHIFCLSCLFRYMHSTDDIGPVPEKKVRWKRCPICDDSIYISEVRPVRWFVGQEGEPPREGADVVLRLMRRDGDSTLALPKESIDSGTIGQEIPWYCMPEVMDYARIMKGSAEYMQDQFDQEINDIETQEKEDELLFEEDNYWTQKAVASCRDGKERVKNIGSSPPGPSFKSLEKRSTTHGTNYVTSHSSDRVITTNGVNGMQSASISASTDYSLQLDATNKQSLRDHGRSTSSTTPFYFYQTLLHYYLAPLDIRILKAAFEDYSLFPSAVLARVEHVSTGHIVDDDLRKRTKYLAHLPQGCEVGFLECDWTDIVPAEILQRFSAELERRRKKNRDKEAREEKERVRAEKEEDDKRWASIRRQRDSASKERVVHSTEGFNESSSLEAQLAISGVSTSPQWLHNRAGYASLASPSTSPSGPKTVWGTTYIPSIESPPLVAEKLSSELENDGWLQGWERDLLHEDDLLVNEQIIATGTSTTLPIHGNKKKKAKKITLMSTNGRRAA